MAGWHPWRELRRREHLVFRLARLPGGIRSVYWPKGQRAAIIIDPRLGRMERRATLAHELIHDERGGGSEAPGMPAAWAAVVTRDERQVDDEVARRLVPIDDLAAFAGAFTDMGEPVPVWVVAQAFDVPEHVAERALLLLQRAAEPVATYGFGDLER